MSIEIITWHLKILVTWWTICFSKHHFCVCLFLSLSFIWIFQILKLILPILIDLWNWFSVFVSTLDAPSPRIRVSVKVVSFCSRNFILILFKLLRKVFLSSGNKGRCRSWGEVDSVFNSQLYSTFRESWKLCLNLW